jgi:hypothetical protein
MLGEMAEVQIVVERQHRRSSFNRRLRWSSGSVLLAASI